MKALITGAAGFIGSHAAEALFAQGWKVVGLDNFSTGPRGQGHNVREGSVADRELVFELVRKERPDAILHAAAAYRDPDGWEEAVATNALGTAWVGEAARAFSVRTLVYLQTSLCYGLRPPENPISIGCPLAPEGAYAMTKTAGECLLLRPEQIFSGAPGVVSLRLANAYGPRNLSGPVPIFYERIRRGEVSVVADARRDFVFIDDLVELIVKAMERGHEGVYHASSGRDVSILDIFEEVRSAMGGPEASYRLVDRGPDNAASLLLNPSRTRSEFGWEPSTALADGVREAVMWYEAFGVEETFSHLRGFDGAKR